MTPQVERANASHWPHNQWHPAYASVKDWLDAEAPDVITPPSQKQRNQKRIRLWRRRR